MLVVARFVMALVMAGLAAGGAAAQRPVAVWIDTDPALGEPERDVDDGLALVQAFNSPELAVRGVSVVFGNAPFDRGLPIARRIVAEFGPSGLQVHPGAASAAARGEETDATRAMAVALRAAPLTILALGPATNVATLIQRHPDLVGRIERVIAVAGRRPGQRFTTGTTNRRGHPDFNFEQDPAAFQVLLDSRVPLVLAPFEISSKVWITAADLDRLAAGPAAARALAEPARGWLALWQRLFGVDGFNPFDTLAVGYAISADGYGCERLRAGIRTLPDDVTEPGVQGAAKTTKPFLLAAPNLDGATAPVIYCSAPPPHFTRDLLERLLRRS